MNKEAIEKKDKNLEEAFVHLLGSAWINNHEDVVEASKSLVKEIRRLGYHLVPELKVLSDEECDKRAILTYNPVNKLTAYQLLFQTWAFGIKEGCQAQLAADKATVEGKEIA